VSHVLKPTSIGARTNQRATNRERKTTTADNRRSV